MDLSRGLRLAVLFRVPARGVCAALLDRGSRLRRCSRIAASPRVSHQRHPRHHRRPAHRLSHRPAGRHVYGRALCGVPFHPLGELSDRTRSSLAATAADDRVGESTSGISGRAGADRRVCRHGIAGDIVSRRSPSRCASPTQARTTVVPADRDGHRREPVGMGPLQRHHSAGSGHGPARPLGDGVVRPCAELDGDRVQPLASQPQRRSVLGIGNRGGGCRSCAFATATRRGAAACGRCLPDRSPRTHGSAYGMRRGRCGRVRSAFGDQPIRPRIFGMFACVRLWLYLRLFCLQSSPACSHSMS